MHAHHGVAATLVEDEGADAVDSEPATTQPVGLDHLVLLGIGAHAVAVTYALLGGWTRPGPHVDGRSGSSATTTQPR